MTRLRFSTGCYRKNASNTILSVGIGWIYPDAGCEPPTAQPVVRRITGRGSGGGAVNGDHFSPCFPLFPDRMTLFHEKMTPLLEETPVSVSD